MTCGQCGTENRIGAKFCVECGSALLAGCPSCGTPLAPGAKFCAECGTRIDAAGAGSPAGAASPTAAAAPPEPATERRVVSILFADLVGFTTLAEGRDAEHVRELLNTYFERASETVARYGGTVEKFIGDAVMAVWGAPVAHEDDAERCVRAALDLVDAVRQLGRDAGLTDLQARAGVLTGEAAVAIGAVNQGMVAGDLVNTASRLQGVAEPGSVLVGEATRAAAGGAIAFEPAGEHVVKGKTAPLPAYRALRVVATVRGALRTESLEPPFVGRDTEFRLLRELFHATGRERRARLVSLTGQAGIGKSRLAWEFEKYADGITEAVWWHRGRSPAYGEGVTFWALGEMVRKRAGLAEGDDDATTRARLSDAIAQQVPDPAERTFVEPALQALLGLAEAPSGGRDRLFAGWRLFLERMSESGMVALVFEDLQWADDGLLDFITHLLDWSRSYPIFVLSLARTELLDRRPTWGAGGRAASSLPLGPLDDADMRALLAGLVPGLPEPAVRSILDRADGIPLYAVETVRMLVADGRLEPAGDGVFRPTGRLRALEVPATLQALIAARLDALSAADRTLVQHASVLGKTFTAEALAAVTGEDMAALEPRLRGLVAGELLELETDPSSPERGQYRFVQALIREVAYSTLARRERRARHVAAARYFETLGEDELAPVLASHYVDAWRAMPDDEGGDALRAQARVALRAAADRAMTLGSYEAAARHLEQALEVGGIDELEEADLLERAGSAASLVGQYGRAAEILRRAVDRARSVGDSRRTSRATSLLAGALIDAGLAGDAESLLDEALAEPPTDELGKALLLTRKAHIYIRRGTGAEALPLCDEALSIAERHGDQTLLIDALTSRAAALSEVSRPFEGRMLLEGLARLTSNAGMVAERMRVLINQCVASMDVDPPAGLEIALQTVREARRYGLASVLVYATSNATELGIRTGRWDLVGELFDGLATIDLEASDRAMAAEAYRTITIWRGRPDDPRIAELAGALADVPISQRSREDLAQLQAFVDGDYPAARRLARAEAAIDALNAPSFLERAARAALWMGDAGAMAEDLADFDAVGRVEPWPAAQRQAILGGLRALEGRRTEAIEAYARAISAMAGLGLLFDRALMQLDAARSLGAGAPEAAAGLAEARALFERLEAQPLVERADQLAREADAGRSGARAAGARSPAHRNEATTG